MEAFATAPAVPWGMSPPSDGHPFLDDGVGARLPGWLSRLHGHRLCCSACAEGLLFKPEELAGERGESCRCRRPGGHSSRPWPPGSVCHPEQSPPLLPGFGLVLVANGGAVTISERVLVGRPQEWAETSCIPAWTILWFLLVTLLGKPSVSPVAQKDG